MITNADITIYNHWYDRQARADRWLRVQIPGVSWYGGQKTTVTDHGLQTADTYTVRVPTASAPLGRTFVRPEVWAATEADALATCWTLQAGDIVARGLLDADIPKASDVAGEHFIVTGWKDNRRGSPALRHWRIDGK